MSSLIITAPHSLCFINSGTRDCDTTAFVASHHLVDQLNSNGSANGSQSPKDLNVKYFPSNHHRSEVDLNRNIARNTDYRLNLSQNLSNCALLIDVHSFEREGFGPDVNVVILDNEPGTWYGHDLYNMMIMQGISVAYLLGADYNDITEEARGMGIPAILIEYGEFLSMNIIDRINNVVVDWIYAMLPK